MDFIDANGVGLRCELSGSGERTLVLVHEMGGSLESWDEVAPRFAKSRQVLRKSICPGRQIAHNAHDKGIIAHKIEKPLIVLKHGACLNDNGSCNAVRRGDGF